MRWDPLPFYGLLTAYSVFWLHSAFAKLSDPLRFSGLVAAYDLAPDAWSYPCTILLGAAEALIGVGLWIPNIRFSAIVAGIAILALYALAIGTNLYRGRYALNCGCHGLNTQEPIRPWMLWRHAALALGLLALVLAPLSRSATAWDFVFAASSALLSTLLYLAIDTLLTHSRLPALLKD